MRYATRFRVLLFVVLLLYTETIIVFLDGLASVCPAFVFASYIATFHLVNVHCYIYYNVCCFISCVLVKLCEKFRKKIARCCRFAEMMMCHSTDEFCDVRG